MLDGVNGCLLISAVCLLLQYVPSGGHRQFSTVVCSKVSLCDNIALGTICIHCQIHGEKLGNITFDYFVKLLRHSDISVQDHRVLFSKLCLCDIIQVLLYTNLTNPKTTFKAPLSCEHVVHVTS